MRMPVFDANVAVGDAKYGLSPLRGRRQLLAEMDRHGVGRALIYHANSHQPLVDGTVTDDELDEWRDERLLPQWTGWPTPASIECLQRRHAAGDLTSVRICAGGDRVLSPFQPWLYGELLTWLAEIGAPAVIELPELDPRYPQWVTVLFAYPGTKLLARTKFTKIYKRVGRYPSKLLPPGTDTETMGYPWNNTMDPEPFILPRQLLLLPVGKV